MLTPVYVLCDLIFLTRVYIAEQRLANDNFRQIESLDVTNSEVSDNAYLALIKDNQIVESSLLECAAVITEQCSRLLSASQASVWVASEDTSELRCDSLQRSHLDSYAQSATRDGDGVPGYTSTLCHARVVAAHGGFEDRGISELTSFYLRPVNAHPAVYGYRCEYKPDRAVLMLR